MAQTKKIQLDKTAICISCNHEYGIDKFFVKPIEDDFLPKHVIPYCKDCCERILQKNLETSNGDLERAVWLTCAKLDMPFIKRAYEAMVAQKNRYENKTKKSDKEYPLFRYYYNYVWGNQSMQQATEIWDNFSCSDNFRTEEEEQENQLKRDIEKLKIDWGEQDDLENYKYLVYMYNKYTQNIKIISPQQEDLYRDLCLARLEKRKIEEGKLSGDIGKAQSRILTLLGKLNIDNFDNSKAKTLSEQSLIENISKIEQHTVADYWKDKEKYYDVNKVRKYEEDCVLRPTLNSLIDNRNFDLDIDDVSKYKGISVPYGD